MAAGAIVAGLGLGGAAAWPEPTTRIPIMPTAWLLAVEEPLATPATRRLIRGELVGRRVAGALPTHRLDDLARLLRADLDRIDRGADSASVLAEWHAVVDELVVGGHLGPEDVRRLHDAGTVLALRVRPLPPDRFAVALDVRFPRTPEVRPTPVPTVPGVPVRMRMVEVRMNGRPRPDARPEQLPLPTRTGLLPPLDLGEAHGGSPLGVPPARTDGVAVPYDVELDLEISAAGHTWIRTVSASTAMPSWPPPELAPGDERTILGLVGPGSPSLTEGTVASFRATGRIDPPEPGTTAATVDPSVRLLQLELVMAPEVGQLIGSLGDDLVLEAAGRRWTLPLLESRVSGDRRFASPPRGASVVTTVRLEGRRLDAPVELPDRVDVVLPVERLFVELARPPGRAGPPPAGYLDVPNGELRLRDVPIRRLETAD